MYLLAQKLGSPHNRSRVTWKVLSVTGDVAWSTTVENLYCIWWLDLVFDLCDLAVDLIPGVSPPWRQRESDCSNVAHEGLVNLSHVPEMALEGRG